MKLLQNEKHVILYLKDCEYVECSEDFFCMKIDHLYGMGHIPYPPKNRKKIPYSPNLKIHIPYLPKYQYLKNQSNFVFNTILFITFL